MSDMQMRRSSSLLKNMESLAFTAAERQEIYLCFLIGITGNLASVYRMGEDVTDAFDALMLRGIEYFADDILLVYDVGRQPIILGKVAHPDDTFDRFHHPIRIKGDDSSIFAIENENGLVPFRFDTISNRFRITEGADIVWYSDGAVTQTGLVEGSNGNATFEKVVSNGDLAGKHIRAIGGTPVITPTTAGAGSGNSFSVAGNDSSFRVVLTTGTSISAGNVMFVDFDTDWPNTEYQVSITPYDADAAAASMFMEYSTRTVSQCRIHSRIALPASTSHIWGFQVVGS